MTFKYYNPGAFIFFCFAFLSLHAGNIEINHIINTKLGECTGSVELLAEGSASPFNISIEGPNGYFVSIDNVSGLILVEELCLGDYLFYISSANSNGTCLKQLEATIKECNISISSMVSMVCDAGGRIDLVVENGTPPYMYKWNDQDPVENPFLVVFRGYSYAPGVINTNILHTVTVSDASGCETSEIVTVGSILEYAYPEVQTYGCSNPLGRIVFNPVIYNGEGDNITVELRNLNIPYNVIQQTKPIIGGNAPQFIFQQVPPSDYSIVAIDDVSGCKSRKFDLTVSGGGIPNVIATTTSDTDCNSSTPPGYLKLVISGGVAFNYPNSTTGYNVHMFDQDQNLLSVKYVQSNGNIAIVEYFDLPEATICYQIEGLETVDGCGGWTDLYCVDIEGKIKINDTDIRHVCDNTSTNGSITVSAKGGKPPYSYIWSIGSTNSSIQNLSPGEYCVTVLDFNGCQDVECFEIETAEQHITLSSAFFQNNGTYETTFYTPVAGGFNYYIIESATGNVIATGTNDGEYLSVVYEYDPQAVYILNIVADNCEARVEFSVSDCSNSSDLSISLKAIASPLTSSISSDGEIDLRINYTDEDGTIVVEDTEENIIVQWTGPNGFTSTNIDLIGLVKGTYSATVSDGCQIKQISRLVTNCNNYNLSVTAETEGTCLGDPTLLTDEERTGNIDLFIFGTQGPVSIQWERRNPNENIWTTLDTNLPNIESLTSGLFRYTLSDATGCSQVGEVVIGTDLWSVQNFCFIRQFCASRQFSYLEEAPSIEILSSASTEANPCLGTLSCPLEGLEHLNGDYLFEGTLDSGPGEFLGVTPSGLCAYEVGCTFTFTEEEHSGQVPDQILGTSIRTSTRHYIVADCEPIETIYPPDPCDTPWGYEFASEEEQNADADMDGIRNLCDNCPFTPNPYQEDIDNDNVGNACDLCITTPLDLGSGETPENESEDDDGDGVANNCDNCGVDQSVGEQYNPAQCDFDNDGLGDTCDICLACGELTVSSGVECYQDLGCVLAEGQTCEDGIIGNPNMFSSMASSGNTTDNSNKRSKEVYDIEKPLFKVIHLFPNPSRGTVNISYESNADQQIRISVINNLGQILSTEVKDTPSGQGFIPFDLSKHVISADSYLFRIEDQSGEFSVWKVLFIK